jgi:uncharacterized membrane protein
VASNQGHDEDLRHHYDTSRLEAFSDGVFAIAITLLIIEVAVPHVGQGELARGLRDLWPSYFGYALSFFTIGIMWMNHHAMFRDIERQDHILGIINLLLLMCIAFIPFPTAVLADHMRDGGDNALAATLAYGGTFTVTALFFNLEWLYASWGCRLIDDHVPVSRVHQRTRRYLPGTPLYAFGLLLALINTWAAIAWWVALAIFYVIPPEEPVAT